MPEKNTRIRSINILFSSEKYLNKNIIPVLIGFVPVISFLLTANLHGEIAHREIRTHGIPIVIIEVIIVIIALLFGFSKFLIRSLSPPYVSFPFFMLVSIAFFTSIFVSPVEQIALLRSYILIIHILFGFSIFYLSKSVFDGKNLIMAYIYGFCIMLALFLIFALLVPNPESFDWIADLPLASHIRHYGYYSAAIAGMCLGLMATVKFRSVRGLTALGALFLSLIFDFWSGTRGAIAATIGAFLCGLILIPAMRRIRFVLAAIAMLIASAGISTLLPTPHNFMGVGRMVTQTIGMNDVTTGRTIAWRNDWEKILERPYFGYGEGQKKYVSPWGGANHPHNVLMQILLAWGFVGALCIFILAAPLAIRSVTMTRRYGGESMAPFMAIVTLAIYSLFDGTLFHVLPLSIFAACLALTLRGPTDLDTAR